MGEVYVPFLAQFQDPLRNGRKTATTRTKRIGREGDYFVLPGEPRVEFVLIANPIRVPLGFVLDALWDIEGFQSAEEAWDTWREIYSGRDWGGFEQVWLHRFRRVG